MDSTRTSINGIFDKSIQRNEKTGETSFLLRADNKPVLCDGIMQDYLKDTPLSLLGNYIKNNGRVIFKVSDCHMVSDSRNNVYSFLSNGNFKGVGPALANSIVNTLGNDIFSVAREKPIDVLISLIGTNKEIVGRTFSYIKSYLDFEDVYDELKGLGCGYETTEYIYNKFGAECVDRVKNNPYILLYFGMDFNECDKIAYDKGISVCDKKRLEALVDNAMNLNRNSGNTRIKLEDLVEMIKKQEQKAGCYDTPLLFIFETLANTKYVLEETQNNDLFVYIKEDYDNETEIVKHVRRLNATSQTLKNAVPVSEIEEKLAITYAPEQLSSFDVLKNSGAKIITGGPGTGKTTLLNGILEKYSRENPNKEVILCAPTGSAARRMREQTGKDASTIHKLLNICPFESKEKRVYTEKLTADFIIIDECSMVDNEIMALLLKTVKNGALLLLLGDKDQLPSVGCGNVFSDLIESGEVESYKLLHIFRQEGKSLIIDNSQKVINGDSCLITDKNFVVQRFDDEKTMVDKAIDIYKKCNDMGITDLKLFTPSRNKKFASGTISMNRVLKKRPVSEEELTFGYYSFCVGDKVIFSNNNYEKGYYNGEEGVITSIQKLYNEIYVKVTTDDGVIFLERNELKDLELAYAITAHKAQGSECRNAMILVPKKPASMLQRKLLYVEITRAKENVMILTEKDALEEAISTKYEFERNTGLVEKLRSA